MSVDRVVADIRRRCSEVYNSSRTWTHCSVRSHMSHHVMSTFLLFTGSKLKVYVSDVGLKLMNLLVSHL